MQLQARKTGPRRRDNFKPPVSTRARLGNAVTGIMLRESTSTTATATATVVVSSHPRDPGVAWRTRLADRSPCRLGSLSFCLIYGDDKYLSPGMFARWRLTNVCAPLIIVFATDQAGEIGATAPILLSFSLSLGIFMNRFVVLERKCPSFAGYLMTCLLNWVGKK